MTSNSAGRFKELLVANANESQNRKENTECDTKANSGSAMIYAPRSAWDQVASKQFGQPYYSSSNLYLNRIATTQTEETKEGKDGIGLLSSTQKR